MTYEEVQFALRKFAESDESDETRNELLLRAGRNSAGALAALAAVNAGANHVLSLEKDPIKRIFIPDAALDPKVHRTARNVSLATVPVLAGLAYAAHRARKNSRRKRGLED